MEIKQTEQTQITTEDVIAMHEIIRAVSTRGAFRAEEMLAVGTLFEKLTKHLVEQGVVRQVVNQSPAPANS